ncbi:MAG TPA: hypothetical protein VK947_10825 [Planococcus sp. (in: firmicutes)]|nr:hypothetical protein [Planococcus sp. (in: firmicutes)]
MEKQENWWEPIFSGELEVGINKESLERMEQESFLYFNEIQLDTETSV